MRCSPSIDRLDIPAGRDDSAATPMGETSPGSAMGGIGCGRRAVLTLALGVGLSASAARRLGAEPSDPRRQRPQADDRFVFAEGARKGQVITLSDLPARGRPVTAYPMDPATGLVRDDSRLNLVLLVRLDPATLNGDTPARAAEGIVAYSAVCTHTGCDAWEWQPTAATIKCSCHFSEFQLNDGARVVNGPAPRRLPALPLKIIEGVPAVAGGFVGRPGFESGGG
jgi:rieske iron-sulfur protein